MARIGYIKEWLHVQNDPSSTALRYPQHQRVDSRWLYSRHPHLHLLDGIYADKPLSTQA